MTSSETLLSGIPTMRSPKVSLAGGGRSRIWTERINQRQDQRYWMSRSTARPPVARRSQRWRDMSLSLHLRIRRIRRGRRLRRRLTRNWSTRNRCWRKCKRSEKKLRVLRRSQKRSRVLMIWANHQNLLNPKTSKSLQRIQRSNHPSLLRCLLTKVLSNNSQTSNRRPSLRQRRQLLERMNMMMTLTRSKTSAFKRSQEVSMTRYSMKLRSWTRRRLRISIISSTESRPQRTSTRSNESKSIRMRK